jgi:N-carbamoylputrescine amidase
MDEKTSQTLRIALLQMVSCGSDLHANEQKGEDFCRRAAAMGAHLALFPEMWSVGYTLPKLNDPQGLKDWQSLAIIDQDNFIHTFRHLARQLDMAIALTYLENWNGLARNSLTLINRKGERVLTYAKVHTCDFDREIAFTPGEDFPVCELETPQGNLNVGAMICFDREFPEPARILMLKGAELILVPNACEMEANRLAQLSSRAMENMLAIALANYAAPQENGHSIIFDGMAFAANEGSRDMRLVEAGPGEGIYLADLNLDQLRSYRKKEAWGNAFRKPRLYHQLVSEEVKPPFIRRKARR